MSSAFCSRSQNRKLGFPTKVQPNLKSFLPFHFSLPGVHCPLQIILTHILFFLFPYCQPAIPFIPGCTGLSVVLIDRPRPVCCVQTGPVARPVYQQSHTHTHTSNDVIAHAGCSFFNANNEPCGAQNGQVPADCDVVLQSMCYLRPRHRLFFPHWASTKARSALPRHQTKQIIALSGSSRWRMKSGTTGSFRCGSDTSPSRKQLFLNLSDSVRLATSPSHFLHPAR